MRQFNRPRGFVVFTLILAGLVALDVILAVTRFPQSWTPVVTPVVTALYVSTPIWALYEASREQWSWKPALALLVTGVAIHATVILPVHTAHSMGEYTWMRAVAGCQQAGLLTWCLGLGAGLALLLKDRNLLLPVAIFLAAFDIFVILTPGGPTRHLMQQHPDFFNKVAMQIPKAAFTGTEVGSGVAARVGPADMFLLAMFFIALTRFGMKATATFRAVAPALMIYLFIVLVFGSYRIGPIRLEALPALVPIGAVILIVNRNEFHLSRDERMSTAVVAALGIGLIVFGATRPRPMEPPIAPVEPLPKQGARGPEAPVGSHGRAVRDQRRSDSPIAPKDTPSPP